MKKSLPLSLLLLSGCIGTSPDDVSSFHEHLKQRMSVQWQDADDDLAAEPPQQQPSAAQ